MERYIVLGVAFMIILVLNICFLIAHYYKMTR